METMIEVYVCADVAGRAVALFRNKSKAEKFFQRHGRSKQLRLKIVKCTEEAWQAALDLHGNEETIH